MYQIEDTDRHPVHTGNLRLTLITEAMQRLAFLSTGMGIAACLPEYAFLEYEQMPYRVDIEAEWHEEYLWLHELLFDWADDQAMDELLSRAQQDPYDLLTRIIRHAMVSLVTSPDYTGSRYYNCEDTRDIYQEAIKSLDLDRVLQSS